MNIFDLLYEDFKFPKDYKIKLFEAFAGVGMQRMAMNKINANYEMIGISEIDKHAINSYMAIHGPTKNWGSITDVKGNELPQIDMFTYSFPCTDLSKAGQQKGMTKETRSGLVYEVLRILQECKENNNLPKVLIMENVIDLIQVKYIKQFNEIQKELRELGYSNYSQTMNAKHYGMPQNRDRVFMVSILGEYNYSFKEPFDLKLRLSDLLQPVEEVDQKYYLSSKQIESISNWKSQQCPLENSKTRDDQVIQCITAKSNTSMNASMLLINEATEKGYKEAYEGDGVYINRPHQKRGVVQKDMIPTLKTSGQDVGVVVYDVINPLKDKTKFGWHFEQQVHDVNGICRSVKAAQGSGNIPKIIVDVDKGVCVPVLTPDRIEKRQNGRRFKEDGDPMFTLTTQDRHGVLLGTYNYGKSDNFMKGKSRVQEKEIADCVLTSQKEGVIYNDLTIRKLTPKECWRLMAINDEDFEKAQKVTSNAQLYKQAGNGIVVDVFAYILENLIENR